jgi:hypothetical protein
MVTVELTDEEARITREALKSMLGDFGHDEMAVVRLIQSALAKVDAGRSTQHDAPV